ncbi:hypothetical protein [Nocardioides antri]|uniref:Uncharacterized protein n=1 Tax=Nocardioides antri TaxID=2607659 RepID=A0A5B1M1K0_9ACTN|nr:hypothetical protein [Nocardioides antri]KAA1426644.1 hypothetical protein F0U47_12925 [Nocardioides antri]
MSSSSLEVPRRSQPAKRSKMWRIAAIVGAVILVVGWVVWFLRTPDDLPTTDRTAEAKGVVGQEVYVGMLAVGDDFGRTLTISEVAVDVEADGDVEVTPQVCHDGSLSVTTDASGWCPELVDPEDAEFSDGDSIVLVVSADQPATVEIGRIEISFREGIRSGTKEAGLEGATLSFADHTPGTVEETPEPDDETGDRPGDDEQDEPKDEKKKKDRQGENA